MKQFFLLFLATLFLSISHSQVGQNYSLDLSVNSVNSNIKLSNGIITKVKASKKASFTSPVIQLPFIKEKQPFIALATKLEFATNNNNIYLEYRYIVNNNWSEWLPILADEHSPNSKLIFQGEQVYLNAEAQELQFKVGNETNGIFELTSLNYRLFFPSLSSELEIHETTSSNQAKAINCSCPIPDVEYRNDWCPSGNCPQDASPSPTSVSHLVVHHSAGSNSSPDWAATVRSIWDYHVNSNGWDDVGYNYLIDPDGVIYEGRGDNVSGAHFSCMNAKTMGVCLLGNFSNAIPSSAMINSLTEIMAWKSCKIDEDPRDTTYFSTGFTDLINLCGHRDGNNIPASCTVTECPGNNVYAIMNTIRANVFNYTQSCTLNPMYSNIVVANMNASPNPIYVNNNINLNLSYRNSGDADINENLTISYQIDATEIATSSFSSLSINQTRTENTNYTFNLPGTYRYCCYIDAASNELNSMNNSFCIDLTVLAEPDTTTAIIDVGEEKYRIYPNPVKNILNLDGFDGDEEIIIYTTLGQEILRFQGQTIDLSSIAKGVYALKITSLKKPLNKYTLHFVKI